MKFVSMREFRASGQKVTEELAKNSELILTIDGKPAALIISLQEENFDDTVQSVRQAKVMRLVNSLRRQSAQNEIEKTSMDEIEEEIRTFRAENRSVERVAK